MKKRPLYFVGGALLLVLGGMQLAPVERTNPAVTGEVDAPPEVAAILRRACYDCHSNETRWPWYSRVAPVSWLVAKDVDEGREHLNFSSWSALDAEAREHALEEIVEEVEEGVMPLWFYLPLHSEARLSEADLELLLGWARGSRG